MRQQAIGSVRQASRRFAGARLSYANVMATLAMFVALGGGSYAAVTLRANQVKQRHLAAGAVTSSKVKNRTLTRADASRSLLAGMRGEQGPPGANGAQGPAGPAGPAGRGKTMAFNAGAGAGGQTLLNTQGLRIVANCPGGGGGPTLVATSTGTNGIIHVATVNSNGAPGYGFTDSAGSNQSVNMLPTGGDTETIGNLVYQSSGGTVIAIQYSSDYSTAQGDCVVAGSVQSNAELG